MIEVKQSSAHDVARIMPTMQSAFSNSYGERWTSAQCTATLSLPDTALWIAYENRLIVGFAITRWVLDEKELLMIGVTPDARRNGVASHLLYAIIHHAKEKNIAHVFLEVRENNTARDFYLAHGFRDMGRRKSYYAGDDGYRYDAITMSRDII